MTEPTNDDSRVQEDPASTLTLAKGIESRPNICGGDARIAHTRIPVWLLELARRLGADHARLLTDYPSLREEDLENAWAYVESHQEEIENAIAENEID